MKYQPPRPQFRRPVEQDHKVLRLVAEGHTNRQIAHECHCSTSTIDSHIRDLMRKHHAVNRAMLAVAAVRVGAITVEVQA